MKLKILKILVFTFLIACALNFLAFLTDFKKIISQQFFPENYCKLIVTGQKIKIENQVPKLEFLEDAFKGYSIQKGGQWSPKNCMPSFKLALIVPHLNRHDNLKRFLRYIHPFLISQNIYYGVYVVEAMKNVTFNKGIIMNAAFLEALKDENWDCFVFNDVDNVPLVDNLVYKCNPNYPIHISESLNRKRKGNYANNYFGGVVGFTKNQFLKINGFSNLYFLWGKEDDDVRERSISVFGKVERLPPKIGEFYHFSHKPQSKKFLVENIKLRSNVKQRIAYDGLNSLEYNIVKRYRTPLFTRLIVSYDAKKIKSMRYAVPTFRQKLILSFKNILLSIR